MGGLLFDRKHFHANVAAGVLVIWWANEPEQCLPQMALSLQPP
jgi:hypothetical protein